MKKNWIDSHCHLADPRLDLNLEGVLIEAKAAGIQFFLQGGVGPQDWNRQRELKEKHSEIGLCFGLHPYWIADHSQVDCEKALDLLAMELSNPEVLALGELGLDFRPSIMKDSQERQIEFFNLQLELSIVAGKPLVLHFVRAFKELKWIMQMRSWPARGGFVHSFSGSVAEAEFYLNAGLHLSIGTSVLKQDNQKLHQAVAMVPLERLLIETDSPDQPPPNWQNGLNQPVSLIQVAEKIAQIKKIPSVEVLDRSAVNLRKLLACKLI